MVKNLKLLDKALQLLPEVKETIVEPKEASVFAKPLKKGDSVEIDFGRHLVGHLKLNLGYAGSHPDAPVWLRFSFASFIFFRRLTSELIFKIACEPTAVLYYHFSIW